jgi:hypothetical protein
MSFLNPTDINTLVGFDFGHVVLNALEGKGGAVLAEDLGILHFKEAIQPQTTNLIGEEAVNRVRY